jgi:diguanylate cyclase (GGDEF)-like protein
LRLLRRIALETLLATACCIAVTGFACLCYSSGSYATVTKSFSVGWFGMYLAIGQAMFFAPFLAIQNLLRLRELNRTREEYDQLANTDPLTGLLNRRGFDRAARALASEPRSRDRPLAALLCDIDFFKGVNDAHGHEFGDAALIHVAAVLRAATAGRADVVLGRQGGEEFVVLLSGCAGPDALAIAEALRSTMAGRPIEWNDVATRITMSVGFAVAPRGPHDVGRLIASADLALYSAKRGGRNRVAVAPEPRLAVA